jgi:TonB family protein
MYKNWITAAVILCGGSQIFSQGARPVVKNEKLKEVQFVSEITPALWPKMWLPYKERTTLDQLSRMAYSESFIYPNKYNSIVEYYSVDIQAICYGKTLSAHSFNDVLTAEQKNILNMADAGTDLVLNIGFKYKNINNNDQEITKGIIEGNLVLTVLPEIEAEYPGGYLQITEYLKKSVKEKMSINNINKASVKFTVNENGKVSNARIFRTSGNRRTDKLLLEATTNMPKWKPAKNSKGIAVKQEFHVVLSGELNDGC